MEATKSWRENYFQPTILHPGKLLFKCESQMPLPLTHLQTVIYQWQGFTYCFFLFSNLPRTTSVINALCLLNEGEFKAEVTSFFPFPITCKQFENGMSQFLNGIQRSESRDLTLMRLLKTLESIILFYINQFSPSTQNPQIGLFRQKKTKW